MRISDKQVQQVIRAYGDQVRRQDKATAKKTEQTSHEIKLSADSQDFLSALQALKGLPEGEDPRVDALQRQVESGTYQVNPEQVARKMINRSLVDRLL